MTDQSNEATQRPTLGVQKPKCHLYSIGVILETGKRDEVLVYAMNRAQANAVATRAGYIVADVNMIG